MRHSRFVTATAGALFALALSACGSGGSGPMEQAAAPAAAPSMAAPSMAPAMAPGQQFGAGCAAVPTDASNPGSFTAMAKVPVATAASGNPVLSTLVGAVNEAGLVDSLNSAPALTVFTPANSAFAKIPQDTLNGVLADEEALTEILTYHVVPGRLSPDQLAGTHTTLEGEQLTVAGSGTSFTVDGSSSVVCGNVETANATVYIVDTVLMPPAS
jgi:uncharacterized surface protein with fasciclin (FAS1) repeats